MPAKFMFEGFFPSIFISCVFHTPDKKKKKKKKKKRNQT